MHNEKENKDESTNQAENQAKEMEEVKIQTKTMKPEETQTQLEPHLLQWGDILPTVNSCETL